MDSIDALQPPAELDELASRVWLINTRPPRDIVQLDDNIPLHGARLLLLIQLAGRPQSEPRIEGRTKLAKLDFFVRYPEFLQKAAHVFAAKDQLAQIQSTLERGVSVESHMIRYKYGPWDKKYYLVLAYLLGKKLIRIESKEPADRYYLSPTGHTVAAALLQIPEFELIATRCRVAGDLFAGRSGTWIKEFIYRHFPEVVRTPYTQIISSPYEEESDAE